MKTLALTTIISSFLICGCATDTGFYVETKNAPIGISTYGVEVAVHSAGGGSNKSSSLHPERTFGLPDVLDVISPRPRSALFGRWRCNMSIDSCAPCFDGKILTHVRFCEEYVFREDGTYSKWRVSKRSDVILPETEEMGLWEYGKAGELCLKRRHGIARFDYVMAQFGVGAPCKPECQDIQDEKPFNGKLSWHSDSEFTVRFINCNPESHKVETPYGTGEYDSEGCLRSDMLATSWTIMMPLRFRKLVR